MSAVRRVANRFRVGVEVSKEEVSPYVKYHQDFESGDSVSCLIQPTCNVKYNYIGYLLVLLVNYWNPYHGLKGTRITTIAINEGSQQSKYFGQAIYVINKAANPAEGEHVTNLETKGSGQCQERKIGENGKETKTTAKADAVVQTEGAYVCAHPCFLKRLLPRLYP